MHLYWGLRPQASLVLSCPGLELRRLLAFGADGPSPGGAPRGLEEEIAAARSASGSEEGRAQAADSAAVVARLYRRAARQPGFAPEAAWRARLARELGAGAEDDPPEGLPAEGEGLDLLPLFWDGPGRIAALSGEPDGVQVLLLDPRGGVRERLGPFLEPERRPTLAPEARPWLEGYLRYLLARDQFVDSVVAEWTREPRGVDLRGAVDEALRTASATVLARAALRARQQGRTGENLGPEEVLDGIRATDADLVDRPAPGASIG